MNKTLAWFGLSKIEELSNKQIKSLLNLYKEPEVLWNLNKTELQKAGMTEKQSEQLIKINETTLQLEMEQLNKLNIKFITITDKNYPKKLKQIFDYPYWLYSRGNERTLQEEGFAIIGSRNCTNYGAKVASKLSYEIAKQNKNVVSGLARGIDSYAHIGCIKARGKTIAVLGCGIDVIYPKENKRIYEAILETDGVIISEYPPKTLPLAKHFPARNRIISGISSGVIVVEAGEKSGSFITVDYALEQGKNIYVVPGNITSIYSKRN